MDPIALARDLVAIASPTGEEAAVVRYVAQRLEAMGLSVEWQEVAPDRFNLLATAGEAPRVVFSTHLDTVPGMPPVSEDDTHLYGRGSCDAKGIAAVQIAAAHRLIASGERRIGLLFTIDEEVASAGARAANEHPLAAQCAFLVNGEPTENRLGSGTKGSLRMRLAATGREAHSAYPENGTSAISLLIQALNRIDEYDWPAHEVFGDTTINVGVIGGGTRSNVIAGSAHAEVHVRVATSTADIERTMRALAGGDVAVEVLSASEPMELHTVDGFETEAVRFTTDIPYLSAWGTPLLLGPGTILDAHTDGERVAKADLHTAVDLYEALGRRLLGSLD